MDQLFCDVYNDVGSDVYYTWRHKQARRLQDELTVVCIAHGAGDLSVDYFYCCVAFKRVFSEQILIQSINKNTNKSLSDLFADTGISFIYKAHIVFLT